MIVAGALTPMLIACSPSVPSTWTAFAYPYGTTSDPTIIIGGFTSLEACQAATKTLIGLYPNTENASSECGYKCRPYVGVMQLCDKTVD